jgi:hypothetical protein
MNKFTKNDLMNLMADIIRTNEAENRLIDLYCKQQECKACYGTGIDGEPNGYGCKGLNQFEKEVLPNILNRIYCHQYNSAISLINSIKKPKKRIIK